MIMLIKSICMSEGEYKFENYYNVWKSFIYFPETLLSVRLLTVSEIIRTNTIITGKYLGLRTVNVYPFGYDINSYCKFEKVEDELYYLIDLFNQKSNTSSGRESVLNCFSLLYRKFLKIHPFIDGNGRTIKVIISKCYMYEFDSCLIWKCLDHQIVNNLLRNNYDFEKFVYEEC